MLFQIDHQVGVELVQVSNQNIMQRSHKNIRRVRVLHKTNELIDVNLDVLLNYHLHHALVLLQGQNLAENIKMADKLAQEHEFESLFQVHLDY